MDFNDYLKALEPEVIKSIQKAIQIKSVEEEPLLGMPFGKRPYDDLKFMLELGKNMRFKKPFKV